MWLKLLFFYEITKICQQQMALPPDASDDAFSTRNSLFKTTGAGYVETLA